MVELTKYLLQHEAAGEILAKRRKQLLLNIVINNVSSQRSMLNHSNVNGQRSIFNSSDHILIVEISTDR
jgi:hypothetical protein